MQLERAAKAKQLTADQELNLRLLSENKYYYVKTKEIAGELQYNGIEIKYNALFDLLYHAGFRRLDIGQNSILVRLSGKIVKQVTPTAISDYLFELYDTMPKNLLNDPEVNKSELKECLLRRIANITNLQKLHTLRPKEPIEFLEDTAKSKYLFFSNCWIEVSKGKTTPMDYRNLPGYIWESSIIGKVYNPHAEEKESEVRKLFQLMAGGDDRRRDLEKIVGYYLHSYTDGSRVCLALTDSNLGEDVESNGGSGKTLLCKIIGNALTPNIEEPSFTSFVMINGKDFDPGEKHKYARCNYDTKLVVINDLRKNFYVEHLYNDITEGISVDKKGIDPFSLRPKLIITYNVPVRGMDGESSKRRFLEFELSNHFHSGHTPEDEFGHWLFRDWDQAEYERYYKYMAHCVESYFNGGCKLPKVAEINLSARKLRAETSQEFVDFMTDWTLNNIRVGEDKFSFTSCYPMQQIRECFQSMYKDFDRLTQRQFNRWLRSYINHHSDLFKPYAKDQNEIRIGGVYHIKFIAA